MHCSTRCCMPWPLAPLMQVRFLRGLFVCPRLSSGDRLPSPAVIYQTLCQTTATDPSGRAWLGQGGMQPLRAIRGRRGGSVVRAAGTWVGVVRTSFKSSGFGQPLAPIPIQTQGWVYSHTYGVTGASGAPNPTHWVQRGGACMGHPITSPYCGP